jgi:hypothetical protein
LGISTSYNFPRGLIPKVNAYTIYYMGKSSFWASRDTIPIVMGVKDAEPASFVMIAVHLHRFTGAPNNATAFLRRVFQGEFGVQP